MLEVLRALTVILVALAMVPAVAHALELPGKLRLTREAYLAVQPIYYPGFTIAGMSEPFAIISTIVLLLLTSPGSSGFWWTLVALLGLIIMHAVYWVFTHPVNDFWLRGERLSSLGSGFFAVGSAAGKPGRHGEIRPVEWTDLRDRWEYSHVARAGLAAFSFIALVIANSSAAGS